MELLSSIQPLIPMAQRAFSLTQQPESVITPEIRASREQSLALASRPFNVRIKTDVVPSIIPLTSQDIITDKNNNTSSQTNNSQTQTHNPTTQSGLHSSDTFINTIATTSLQIVTDQNMSKPSTTNASSSSASGTGKQPSHLSLPPPHLMYYPHPDVLQQALAKSRSNNGIGSGIGLSQPASPSNSSILDKLDRSITMSSSDEQIFMSQLAQIFTNQKRLLTMHECERAIWGAWSDQVLRTLSFLDVSST